MTSKVLYFRVSGLTCAHCEQSIESMVQQHPEVQACAASHTQGLLKVQCKEATSSELHKLQQTLKDEISDIYPLQLIENPFEQPKQAPVKPYFKKAVMNGVLGLGWHLLKASVLAASWSTPSLIGMHILMLGLMVWTGSEFYHDAWKQLKHKSSNMNTLVSLSTLLAWSHSLLNVLVPTLFTGALFSFMPIFMILGLTNLGRSIRQSAELKACEQTKSFEATFKKFKSNSARRCTQEHDLSFETILTLQIQPGDVLEIHEGEPFPTDGTLLSEHAWVNQKIFTGEPFAQLKKRHDSVSGGTLNTQGTVRIRALCKEQDNALMRLFMRVREAQLTRSQNFAWVDAISAKFVPVIFGIALVAGGAWMAITGTPLLAFNAMISVLLCACPCALGLAAPITNALGLNQLLHKGILVKDADSLKTLSEADTIVFDKTGTLTEPSLNECFWAKGFEALGPRWVASMEEPFAQKHPIAHALKGLTEDPLFTMDSKLHESGQGLVGSLGDKGYLIGSAALLIQSDVAIPETFTRIDKQYRNKGLTPIYVCQDKTVIGLMGLEHHLKPSVEKTLKALKAQGVDLRVMTGDKQEATNAALKGLPLDSIQAQMTSIQKKQAIEALKSQGRKVAFVGDGLNDFEAAQASDVSISIEAWTHLASQAQISLKSDLMALVQARHIAHLLQTNIKQNLAWTFFYNSISVLAASGALTPWLGLANPIIFSATMALSSLVVIGNALRVPGLVQNYYQRLHSDQTYTHKKPSLQPGQSQSLSFTDPSMRPAPAQSQPKPPEPDQQKAVRLGAFK